MLTHYSGNYQWAVGFCLLGDKAGALIVKFIKFETRIENTYVGIKVGLLAVLSPDVLGQALYKLHTVFIQISYSFEAINIVCIFIQ